MARLHRHERLMRKVARRQEQLRQERIDQEKAVIAARGSTPVKSSLNRWPSQGTSKPGANLLRAKAPYTIDKMGNVPLAKEPVDSRYLDGAKQRVEAEQAFSATTARLRALREG